MEEAGHGGDGQSAGGRDPLTRAMSIGCNGLLAGAILIGTLLIVLQVIQGEINDRLLDRAFRLLLLAGILVTPFLIPRFARRATGTGMNFRDLQPAANDDGYWTGSTGSYLGEPIASSPAWLLHGPTVFHGYTAGVLHLGDRLLFVAPDGEVILDVAPDERRQLKFRWGKLVFTRGGRTFRITFLPPDSTGLLFDGVRCHWRWKRLLKAWARGERPLAG